jgi:hypothetical protein
MYGFDCTFNADSVLYVRMIWLTLFHLNFPSIRLDSGISCVLRSLHPTKRVHCSIFIHTNKGSVKCPHAPPPYIFCRFTAWTKGFRMTPFSRVISFLSGVLGSRRLAIVDDLGLPRGVLSRYESISPGHSKPFVLSLLDQYCQHCEGTRGHCHLDPLCCQKCHCRMSHQ